MDEFHPVVLAADSTDLQANTLTRISEAFSKGIPAAAVSGAMSIYNTFLDYSGQDLVDTELAVSRFAGSEIGDYYAEHKAGADLVGFVGTALAPMSLGTKALQLARSGITIGGVGEALGYTASRKNYWLQQALKETADGGTVKSLMQSSARRKQLGWEMADQALIGTAQELATVALMNDSPIFDNSTAGDFAFNVALGTGLAGTIGGGLGSLAAKGILKSAEREIQAQSRLVDTIYNPSQLGLVKGSELSGYLENMLTLPDGMEKLGFKYKYDGKWRHIAGGLNIGDTLDAAKAKAIRQAQQEIDIGFNDLAAGDAAIGQAYAAFVKSGISAAQAAGKSPDEIVEVLRGYLSNVEKIEAVDLERMALDARKFYVNLKPTGDTDFERLVSSFSKERTAGTTRQAYMLADEVTAADLSIVRMDQIGAINVKEAWKLAPEADAVQLPDGSFRFNPRSEKVLKYSEAPHTVRMFIDLETGTLTPQTVPVFGDLIKQGKFVSTIDYVAAGNFRQEMRGIFESKIDDIPLEGSARFAWASRLSASDIAKITRGFIGANDIPLLQRIVELEQAGNFDTLSKLSFETGYHKFTPYKDIVNLKAFVEEARLGILERDLDRLGKAGTTVESRIIAANLGTTREWVEETISAGINPLVHNQALRESGILSTEAALTPRNVAVQWNFGVASKMVPEDAYRMNMGPSHLATMELSWQYQMRVRKNVADNAMVVLGDDADLIFDVEQFAANGAPLSRTASAEGAGATLLGASNANYGQNAKLAVQELGKNVSLVTQRRRDAAIETLSSHVNAIKESPEAAAELSVLTTALRKSPLKYVLDAPQDLTAFGAANAKVRLVSTDVLNLARRQYDGNIDEALDVLEGTATMPHAMDIKNREVAAFIRTHSTINSQRRDKLGVLYNARGLTIAKHSDLPVIYVPPINTVRYPYHAFVKTKNKVGLGTDVGMVTARTEEQLRTLTADLGDDFDVFFKSDTDNYFKAKGEYDYNLTLNEGAVNSELARRDKLADAFPETRAENILEDYLQFHAKGEEKLVRTAAEVRNGQFFSEMKFLSKTFRREAESVTRGIGSRFKSKVADPFGDYIKTALNISKQQEFPLLDSLNEFVDKLGMEAGQVFEKGFRDAKSGLISWERANELMEQYGMRGMYGNIDQYVAANERYPRNLIREGLQKANMLLAGLSLRLDVANSLLNIISTPIMLGTELSSIRQMLKTGSPELGKLNELMSIKVPGRAGRVPTMMPRLADAINNYFGADNIALIARYRNIGAIKDISALYHEVLDDLTFRPGGAKSWFTKLEAGIEKGSKLTGNNMSEELTRFISADVMRQLTDPIVEAGRMTVREQDAYISTFVNRVQGNYVTSQRPIAFQGTTGAAISLFQTYTFNVLQQLHRHMGAGDKKTLAIFAGLQGSIYGLNGLPFFDAVNTHLIGGLAAGNPEHRDLYNTLPSFNKELGDWMLYGTASAFPLFSGSSPALYTRGDMNPRHITLIPINPLDVPAVNASIRVYDTITGMGKNILQGADVGDSLLKGLEHQGLNRPLAGFAQLLAGRTTTSQGAIISAANDLETAGLMATVADRVVNFGGVSRLMGARPMDESIALNTLYRQKQYQAMDRARLERLGEVVKTKLYGGQVPTDEEYEDFMLRYTRSGGRIESFAQAMQRWSRDANQSVVNQLAEKNRSHYSQTLQTIMGGERLRDYTTESTIMEGE